MLTLDPYKLEAAKFRVWELAKDGAPSGEAKEKIKEQLALVRDYTADEDWGNNLFAGVAYFALGEQDEALMCVEPNVDFGYETAVSGAVLAQINAGKLEPETLSGELAALLQNIESMEEAEPKLDDPETLRKAAEKGDAEAQVYLGMMYSDNYEGIEQDYKQAVEWYRKAAEQGDTLGQHFLAYMYADGKGVTQDYKQAEEWYCKAVEHGNAKEQYDLGDFYYYEMMKFIPKDYRKAAEWYRRAAEQGHAEAQGKLGLMYANGEGVTQDYQTAYMWCYLAHLVGGDPSSLTIMRAEGQLIQLEKSDWFSSPKVSKQEAAAARAEAERKFEEIKRRNGQ